MRNLQLAVVRAREVVDSALDRLEVGPARAVALKPAVIDVIDSKTMQRRLGEADPVLRALVRNLTIRLADANELNERQWQMLKIYNSLSPGDIRLP